MKKLKCLFFGHLNYYQMTEKYHLTSNCLRCRKPMHNNRKEDIIKAMELSQSKYGKDWLNHIAL